MKTISTALVKAQSKFKPVDKSAENPFYKSMYADLSSILAMVTPILNSEGIAISQPMRIDGDRNILSTQLIHESGEIMTSEIILPNNPDPQKQGIIITYYKRYQLQAMLGVSTADEDDDGNGVSIKNKPDQKPKSNWNPPDKNDSQASPAQINALKKLYPGVDLSNLTKTEAKKMFDALNNAR